MSENRIVLGGDVLEREALRYTPAGIPILNFRLKHASTQVEAAIPRQIGFEIDAMAVGQTAQDMNSLHAGQRVLIRGFLASRSRLSSRLVLHVDQYELD